MPVVLLCHFDGTNGSTAFTDVSTYAHALTATNATVSTTSPKFGTGGGNFTAGGVNANPSIDTGNAVDFNLGSGPFTVEAWGYFTSAPGSNICGVLTQFGGVGLYGWFLGMVSGSLAFYYSLTGSDNPSIGAAYTPALNTWIHLAADRDASNVVRVYANGVVIASATVSAPIFASPWTCMIGNDHNANRNFPGYLDEARVTIGLAQYGGPFTPPTGPFTVAAPIELAGNLGGISSYGKLSYGLKKYSRVPAFTPILGAAAFTVSPGVVFSGDLAPAVSFGGALEVFGFVDLGGDIAPQIALEGALSLDLPLSALEGGLTPIVVLEASSFVSGPLWAEAEPCPSPPWAESEPCPPSMWTPIGPCDPVEWCKSELCNG